MKQIALAVAIGLAAYVLLIVNRGTKQDGFASPAPATWGEHTRPYGIRPDFSLHA